MTCKDLEQIADAAAKKVCEGAQIAKLLKTERGVVDKRVSILQYVNTAILTCIGIVAMMIFITTSKVKESQNYTSLELVRMKTIQDINTNNIQQIDKRVTALELNYLDYIKTWVDQNFIRKAALSYK
jgi:hypothetical protein